MRNSTLAKLAKTLSLIVGCINMQEKTIEQLYQVIGKNVAKYRKEKNMSQLGLSMAMGYKSVSVVSSGEVCYKGKHFNLEQLHKISLILDIEITEFFKPFD